MRVPPALLQLTGVLLFSIMNAVVRHLLDQYPVAMATWWRYLFATLFTAAFWWQMGRPAIRRAMLPVHLLRGLFIALAALAFFFSITRLTLAEAITFTFVAPLLVPPLAALLLGERMDARNIAAAAVGFAGILVAMGWHDAPPAPRRLAGIAAALAGALSYALTVVLMRARAARDGPAVVSLLGAAIPTGLLAPVMLGLGLAGGAGPPTGAAILPAWSDLGWFALAGLCGALALQCFAAALARARPQDLVPYDYSALVWLMLFGWLFFQEPVAARTLAGAAIVIAASLWQARRGSRPAAPHIG